MNSLPPELVTKILSLCPIQTHKLVTSRKSRASKAWKQCAKYHLDYLDSVKVLVFVSDKERSLRFRHAMSDHCFNVLKFFKSTIMATKATIWSMEWTLRISERS
ncbi:hypothetical protein L596_029733 [Steinernema carpocapsae]|uniref:F-box domain-containing protein n=1 Tax=Steinernema carpocapsae TaxID=34508 RepID=A0A4U5LQN0_STECR|nr:hypothetical protein L596_029733 [Steinernema carpocapsae]